jgi:cation-transporting P-type ATPase 13A2
MKEIYGYKESMPLKIIIWFLIVITMGLLRLVLYWKPQWFLKLTHKKCNLDIAEKVLLIVIFEIFVIDISKLT